MADKEHGEFVAELPLGGITIRVKKTAKGYEFYTHDGSGEEDVLAISMYEERRRHFSCFKAAIHLDYEQDEVARVEDLLTPSGRPPVTMLPDGRLYCRKCKCYVLNTANHEMRREGMFAHSHICGVKAAGEKYVEEDEGSSL